MPREHSVTRTLRLLRLAVVALLSCSSFLVSNRARASGVDPTKISLPNGPGSIDGLGRNFVTSLASGTASYGVDIAVPPAAGGLAPALSLEYDAGGGVSEVGVSWRLGGIPSIRRRTENGLPRFDATDTFELSGMGVPSDLLKMADGFYRAQQESAFARVQRSSDGTTWEARTKGGMTLRFGGKGFTEEENGHIATYLLSEQLDLHGHSIRYAWDTSTGYALLTSVTWNDFSAAVRQQIKLTYEDRADVADLYSSGIKRTLDKRLQSLDVTLGGELIRRYTLHYGSGKHSQLTSVDMVGTDGTTALPTLSVEYTQPSFAADGQIVTMLNPPGRSPSDANVTLADLNGDGLPDLLVTAAGQYRSYVNHDGTTWQPPVDWVPTDSPSVALSSTGVQLGDLDGDGAIDLVVKSGTTSFRYFPGKDATHFSPSVGITTVPNFTFEDPDVRLADFDGDRRVDVAITTSAGLALGYNLNGQDWTTPQTIGIIDPSQTLRFSDGHTQLCDVNGDRVEDLCYLRSGSLVYWLGRGRGTFEAARTATGVPTYTDTDPYKLVDLDGDGWVDLVHVGVTQVDFALASSVGRFDTVRAVTGVPTKGLNTAIEFADMDGSGTVDIVWIDVSGSAAQAWRYLELFPKGRAGLLSRIDNGLGKITTISYEPAALSAARARDAGTPWSTRMNVAMPVVSSIEVDASLGDPKMVTQFAYRDGTWDPSERTFAGFGGGTETDVGDEFTPTLISETTFDTGLVARVLRGSPRSTEQRDESGYIFGRGTTDYTTVTLGTSTDGKTIEYAYKSAAHAESIEGTDTSAERITLTEWVQDDFGNVTEERKWGEISGTDYLVGNDEAITVRTFANNTDDWILGAVATEEVQDTNGTRYAAKRNYYDGAAFTGLPLGQVARGDVTRQEEWLGPAADAYELDISTQYNSDGQPVETKDARGGGRIYAWDPDDHTSIQSEQVKLDGSVDLTERAEIDRRFGNLLSLTDYSGQVSRFTYDAFGRVTSVFKAGDPADQPSIIYTYDASAPLSRITADTRIWAGRDDMEHTETLFDGLGRKRGALSRDEDDRWVLAGVALLDARGEARRALRPRFVTSAEVASPPLSADSAGTSSWRDASGRERRSVSQSGIETRSEYAPFLTRRWDGGQTDTTTSYEHVPIETASDGLGRVVSATQTLGGTALMARFTYDAVGQLRSRTDPEGNASRYEFDGRGQRIIVDDPDLGKRTFVYDPTGNVIERHNPDGNVLKYTFDLAGRCLTEDWDGDGKAEVTRHWDVNPSASDDLNYRGKLVSADEPTGSTEHEYDDRGRITASHVTIDGTRYTSGSHFDNLDREVLHIYPDGSSIRIQRNPRGQLAGYGDDAVQLHFDGDGVETQRDFSTGVSQKFGYDDDRRPDEMVATAADGSIIEHLKWDLDPVGNVRALTDLRSGVSKDDDRSETYTYDNLYRLRSAKGAWGQTSWEYSPSGNLLRRTSTVAVQDAQTIAYGAGAGPHAMTSMGSRQITYDALGRMRSDGDRTYTWNGADQLIAVTAANGASEENRFDGDGIRRVRTETGADGAKHTVRFISPWSEVEDGKLVRYIVHADHRIVRLSAKNGAPKSWVAPPPFAPESPRAPPLLLRVLGQLGQLALTLVLLLTLAWTQRRRLARASAVLLPAFALLLLTSCGGSDKKPSIEEGTVKTLSDADTLLVNDQLGSLLSETTGAGKPKASFAAYPYGVARYDTSNETRQYANAPRDHSVGLDLMGARFYAPDLGIWTIGDPALLNEPQRAASEQFAAAHPYAYANLNPVTSIDEDGNFWHIVIGAAVGAVIGGGIEAYHQYKASGKIESWGRVAAAAGGGAISGAITAACPSAGIATVIGVGALSGAAGGVTERLIASGGKSVGSVKEIVTDALVGGASAGLAKGGSAVIKKIAPKVVPKLSDTLKKMFGSAEKEVCAGGACPCFVAGTLIATAAGAEPIERVKLGTRVGPDASACDTLDVSNWFAIELELVGPRGPGDVFHIELLRPQEWVAQVSATQGSTVDVALEELNIQGPAVIRKISQPHVDSRTSGCPVTGTIEHVGYDVMSVKLAGWAALLEVTMAHRLFSESRNDWVAASKLEIGETLRTESGSVVVEGLEKTARAPVIVYNLEVWVGHRYYVGEGRVLAHNAYGGGAKGALNQSEQRAIQKIDNAIRDHMTPHDLSGTVADQMGSPIPKPSGGYWDHAQEMQDTLRGLRNNAAKLQGTTDPSAVAARQKALDAIKTAEDLIKGAGI